MSGFFSNLIGLFFSAAWFYAIFVVIKKATKNSRNGNGNRDPYGQSNESGNTQGNIPMSTGRPGQTQMTQGGMKSFGSSGYGGENPPVSENVYAGGSGIPAGTPYRAGSNTSSGTPYRAGSNTSSGNPYRAGSNTSAGNLYRAAGNNPAGGTYRPVGNTPSGAADTVGNIVDMDGDGKISTVEFLEQKAREDEAKHQRDEYLVKQKLTQGGALRLGQQIPDDGILPRGSRLVNCGYCGAENVIPQMTDPRAFHCYFCHEQLQ